MADRQLDVRCSVVVASWLYGAPDFFCNRYEARVRTKTGWYSGSEQEKRRAQLLDRALLSGAGVLGPLLIAQEEKLTDCVGHGVDAEKLQGGFRDSQKVGHVFDAAFEVLEPLGLENVTRPGTSLRRVRQAWLSSYSSWRSSRVWPWGLGCVDQVLVGTVVPPQPVHQVPAVAADPQERRRPLAA
ncbi:hypothetical protein PG994_008424 [Apiospora phragmitis]|uniref:Uncharacterized protein n=1 Tax=Apiospora phragmitis TaxID=2905665 RepID=A0ABR1UGE3_9PEZI